MALCSTRQMLLVCHSVVIYLQQCSEFQEEKPHVRTQSVNVRKFGHLMHRRFHVHSRWTDGV